MTRLATGRQVGVAADTVSGTPTVFVSMGPSAGWWRSRTQAPRRTGQLPTAEWRSSDCDPRPGRARGARRRARLFPGSFARCRARGSLRAVRTTRGGVAGGTRQGAGQRRVPSVDRSAPRREPGRSIVLT